MTLDRILLQTIKFDLQVEHPYSYLLKYAKCLKGDKTKLQKMVQMAWTFVNDNLCTTLSLQWEPEIIAVALMYLAGKLSKFEVKDWNGRQLQHLRWWDMFVEDVTMDLLEDICHQVLDLYSQANNANPPDSPPLIPSNDPNRERIVAPPTIDSASSTPNVTPSKVPKVEPSVVSSNGCPPAEPIETVQSIEMPSHFAPYPTSYTPGAPGYPPVFPPTNISVPPPSVTINHIVSAMHHLGSSGSMRSNPPTPTAGQPFAPYGYQASATYFPTSNPAPPTNAQRPYYPPQP